MGNPFRWIIVKRAIRPQIMGIFFMSCSSKHRWEVDKLCNTLWCTVLVNLQDSVRQKIKIPYLVFAFSIKCGIQIIHYNFIIIIIVIITIIIIVIVITSSSLLLRCRFCCYLSSSLSSSWHFRWNNLKGGFSVYVKDFGMTFFFCFICSCVQLESPKSPKYPRRTRPLDYELVEREVAR